MTETMTLAEAADRYGLAYSTLAEAAREQRVAAHKSGNIYLVTDDAMEEAIRNGTIRPRTPLVRVANNGQPRCPYHGIQDTEYGQVDPAPCGCAWVWTEDGDLEAVRRSL